jgi:hypothetical protein
MPATTRQGALEATMQLSGAGKRLAHQLFKRTPTANSRFVNVLLTAS